ncbi:SpoIIE family protein phosphatase [Streptomyces bambusae]|uniref:SpoIIE family protein phosphatase n=1 Tax=Streptomyces bambusae TaxID=1550616 RepID=UPI001CFCBC3D|nr:SpoIIE family protein phosphatase [Streptomyces bambusae]MCB5164236.1 SpoIIE family protein phosphatase [Streptomyces bambusae]
MTEPARAPGRDAAAPPPGSGAGRPVPDPGPSAAAEPDPELVAAVRALTREVAELRADRAERHLQDLAVGVLVGQLGLRPGEAEDHLAGLASRTQAGPADIAADIVNAAAGSPDAAPGAPSPDGARAARLARRTEAAVATATGAQQAAAALLDGGLRRLGATEVWLWRRTATDCLSLAAYDGGDAMQATHWQWLPGHVPGPLHTAAATGTPLWLPAGPEHRQPLPGPAGSAARAVLPLRRHGMITGVLLVVWPHGPVAFDRLVRHAVEGIGETAARILDEDPAPRGLPATPIATVPGVLGSLLDNLIHAALVLTFDESGTSWRISHANPVAARHVADVPEPAGRTLAEVLPAHAVPLSRLLAQARQAAAPVRADRIADRHGNALLNVRALPVGPGRAVLLWHTAAEPGLLLPQVLDRLDHLALFEDDLVSGVSRWSERAYTVFGMPLTAVPVPLQELAPRVHPEDAPGLAALLEALTVRREGAQTVLRVVREDGGLRRVRIAAEPLVQGTETVSVTGIYQDMSAQYRTEVALGATYDQLTALEAQALVRHQLVLGLQRAIMPEEPESAQTAGLEVAARYRPAAQGYRVGGDWYDVLPLPDGRVLLAVGDIAGHGVEAATAMVGLRNALRGLAVTGRSAARLLGWLNEAALVTAGQPTATAVCALYDPARRMLRWASAGHLPMLLARDGRVAPLDPPHDLLLGALPGTAYTEVETPLHPGDLLVLYTDGLVERRHGILDAGLAGLARAVERGAADGLAALADGLLAEVHGDTDDDTSLVLVEVR